MEFSFMVDTNRNACVLRPGGLAGKSRNETAVLSRATEPRRRMHFNNSCQTYGKNVLPF
jgi:hypothetical protein